VMHEEDLSRVILKGTSEKSNMACKSGINSSHLSNLYH
jgi:hypothetical protein